MCVSDQKCVSRDIKRYKGKLKEENSINKIIRMHEIDISTGGKHIYHTMDL